MTTYKGLLCLYDPGERSPSPDYWGFQDERYMDIPLNDRRCIRCGIYWGEKLLQEPKAKFTYSLKRDMSDLIVLDKPLDIPSDVFAEMNAASLVCYEQGHPGWEKLHPNGVWSTKGLKLFWMDDHLTIFDPAEPQKILWDGAIANKKRAGFLKIGAELWIQGQPQTIDRKTWKMWFQKNYPAKLVRATK